MAQTTGWSLGTEDSVPAALERAVQSHPERLFLDFSGERYSYGDADLESARVARGLRELGVGRGDRVVSVLDNSFDAVILGFAVHRLGAVHVPVNTAYKGEFLRHQLADCGARVVVAEHDYARRVLAVESSMPDVEALLYRGEPAEETGGRIRCEPLDSYRLDGPDLSMVSRPSDLGALMYTAGTTGPSKGCMISQNYLMYVARTLGWLVDRRSDELNWTPLPLFHLNAWATVLSTLSLGASASIAPRFSVSGFWPDVERTGASIVNLIGTMIPMLAQMDDTEEMLRCKGQIRAVVGVPFTAPLERVWTERFGVELVGTPAYGLTEASGIVSTKVGAGKPGTSGRRNDDFDVRIFDDDDHEVPLGEAGEIVCRPLKPHVMFDGYWNRPEATEAQMRNRWFHTGDIGKFDEEGWFIFVDRKKDYLRRRGENISTYELEVAVMGHDDIAEVAVHSVPSEISEDEVKLTVVLKSEASVTEQDLCQWAIDNLPYFAVPRYIEFRSQLPKNPVGRVLKYQLRDEGVTPATWDREAAGMIFTKR